MPATLLSARSRQLALAAAFLGWLFDGFEMGLFPVVGPPALQDLLGASASGAARDNWFGVIIAVFLVGAASGGVVFGWLGDKIGRVRAMALSILTYALFTGLCGVATEPWQLAGFRFLASLGMGGEWSLGVALVNEVWPGKSRAVVAGLIGAAGNCGYLLVPLLSMSLLSLITYVRSGMLGIGIPEPWVEHLLHNQGWRFLMISGALPALLVFLILAGVPESPRWKEEQARGATSHWANLDLLGVLGGAVAALVIIWACSPMGVHPLLATLITAFGLAAACWGFLHPVRRYMARALESGDLSPAKRAEILRLMLLGAGLGAVALLGTWGFTQWAPKWAIEMAKDPSLHAKEWTQICLSLGAIVATFFAAISAGRFGRRITYSALCIGSLISALILFQGSTKFDGFFLAATFLAGGMTASFYGFFPLYLPELFPTAVRATGQGFAYNFGRILAAIGGLQTANLMALFGGSFPKAASVMAFVYVIGVVLIRFAPETKGQELPD